MYSQRAEGHPYGTVLELGRRRDTAEGIPERSPQSIRKISMVVIVQFGLMYWLLGAVVGDYCSAGKERGSTAPSGRNRFSAAKESGDLTFEMQYNLAITMPIFKRPVPSYTSMSLYLTRNFLTIRGMEWPPSRCRP